MTKQLIILGESLVDSGDTATLAAIIGQNPFEDKRYNRGGNIRASDGPVLGEFIALEMGAKIENAQLSQYSVPTKLRRFKSITMLMLELEQMDLQDSHFL